MLRSAVWRIQDEGNVTFRMKKRRVVCRLKSSRPERISSLGGRLFAMLKMQGVISPGERTAWEGSGASDAARFSPCSN